MHLFYLGYKMKWKCGEAWLNHFLRQMNHTHLMASQLLYDTLVDKLTTGALVSMADLLSYQEIMRLAGLPLVNPISPILRDIFAKKRPVNHGDAWAFLHHLRTGLERKKVPEMSDARVAMMLLRQFWLEKAETGDVLSAPELGFAQMLLKCIPIVSESSDDETEPIEGEKVCPSLLKTPKPNSKPMRLPTKDAAKAFLMQPKSPGPSGLSRIKNLLLSVVPGWSGSASVRKSPRKVKPKKTFWTAQELWSHYFKKG